VLTLINILICFFGFYIKQYNPFNDDSIVKNNNKI
jgi:hypothetical protein